MKSHQRQVAAAFFAALMVPIAILIHVSAEFVSLGLRETSSEMSARHLYLVFVGGAALFVLTVLSNCFASRAERMRRIRYIVAGLPYQGRGRRFASTCFALQCCLFVTSQAFERFPICAGNVLIGVLIGVLLMLAASVLIAALPLPLARMRPVSYVARSCDHMCRRRRIPVERQCLPIVPDIVSTYHAVIGNRPPPQILAI